MRNLELHPEFYNQPVLLTEEEKQNPFLVIREFFVDVQLIEMRVHLHNLLEVALTSPNTIYDDAYERDVIMYFRTQLEKALEASWLISKKVTL